MARFIEANPANFLKLFFVFPAKVYIFVCMETYKERRNYSKGKNTRSKGFLFKMSEDEKKALEWLSNTTGKTQSAILSECLATVYLAERAKYIESAKGA